jgi:hypothetical protein
MEIPVSDSAIQHTKPVRIIQHYPAFGDGYCRVCQNRHIRYRQDVYWCMVYGVHVFGVCTRTIIHLFDMGFKSAVYMWKVNLFHSILVIKSIRETMRLLWELFKQSYVLRTSVMLPVPLFTLSNTQLIWSLSDRSLRCNWLHVVDAVVQLVCAVGVWCKVFGVWWKH